MSSDSEKTVRCSQCGAEFADAEIEIAKACPACKTTKSPMAISHDVTLTLNWHELRCLANWAQNWADYGKFDAETRNFLNRMFDKMRAVQPADTAGLTLRDEIGQLHDAGYKATLYDREGNAVMTPPTVN